LKFLYKSNAAFLSSLLFETFYRKTIFNPDLIEHRLLNINILQVATPPPSLFIRNPDQYFQRHDKYEVP
jgi:hypothetical protein